ncbi:transcriptional regulator [Candidatus Atribacteria bacterium MT.SAG.1]|nr:transcriptional regulator [Candidatus Atribacteria bacterium MT.SAG.1]
MQKATHEQQLVSLKRIEGQIRGIQKMIGEKRYCVDILTQLHSIVGAILRVEDKIFKGHLEGCVTRVLKGKSGIEKEEKIDEILDLLHRFRRVR